jgi:hypothetical protein
MPRRSLLFLLVLLTVSVSVTGCFYSREIAQTRRDIERDYPDARFHQQIVVSLGPASIRALGWLVGLAPEEEAQMAKDYLHEIDRVKVGVYRVDYLPDLDAFDPPTLRRFQDDGWEVAVKSREDDEIVWVMYRERYNTVRDIYTIVLTDEDLVLARVKGHLNRLLEKVMEDHYRLRNFVDDLDLDD